MPDRSFGEQERTRNERGRVRGGISEGADRPRRHPTLRLAAIAVRTIRKLRLGQKRNRAPAPSSDRSPPSVPPISTARPPRTLRETPAPEITRRLEARNTAASF